jgi:hypothetical protein
MGLTRVLYTMGTCSQFLQKQKSISTHPFAPTRFSLVQESIHIMGGGTVRCRSYVGDEVGVRSERDVRQRLKPDWPPRHQAQEGVVGTPGECNRLTTQTH